MAIATVMLPQLGELRTRAAAADKIEVDPTLTFESCHSDRL
jgi:hypothetical protein